MNRIYAIFGTDADRRDLIKAFSDKEKAEAYLVECKEIGKELWLRHCAIMADRTLENKDLWPEIDKLIHPLDKEWHIWRGYSLMEIEYE